MTNTEGLPDPETPMPSALASESQALGLVIPVIIVIGKTGVGKSSFIKLLGGKDVETGGDPAVNDSIDSCTLKPAAYLATVNDQQIMLVDTPGFDDSARENMELVEDIVLHLYLAARAREHLPVHGVVFLYDISENKYTGSQQQTFSMLEMICGTECMGNVIVGTTMWSETESKFQKQGRNEQEILKRYWSGIDRTCRLLEDDRNAAAEIVVRLLSKPPVLLLAQQEMLESTQIKNTTIGRHMMSDAEKKFERLRCEFEEEKRRFEKEKRRVAEEAREIKEKGKEEKRMFEKEKERLAKEAREMKEKEEEMEAKADEIYLLDAIIEKFRDPARLSLVEKAGLNIGASLLLGPRALFRTIDQNAVELLELRKNAGC